jgi:hypothetical protein
MAIENVTNFISEITVTHFETCFLLQIRTFWSNCKHVNHYTTEATCIIRYILFVVYVTALPVVRINCTASNNK